MNNILTYLKPWPAMLLSALIGLSGIAIADETTSAAELRKELADAGEALQGYSADRKDLAVKKAKEVLDKIDKQIERIEARVDEAANDMSKAARAQARSMLRELRERRQAAAEWYGALKHGSAEAWSEVKNGFAKAYDSLQDALMDADEESKSI